VVTGQDSIRRSENQRPRLRRAIGITLMLAGAAAIGVITLTPASPGPRLPLWCLTCGVRPGVDALLNVLLFIPLGVGMGLCRLGFRRAVISGALASILIETLQFTVVAGRFPSARDVLANSLGVALGYLIGRGCATIVRPGPRAARRLAIGGAALWLATQAFTAWAMGIAAPPTPWWSQLQPDYDEYPAKFAGKVIAASIGTIAIDESEQLPRGDDARRQLLAGAPLRAVLTGVEPTRARALVMVISAGPVRDAAFWEQDGRSAVFRIPVRGTFAGLRTPSVRLDDAMPRNPTDTVTLTGAYAGGRYRLAGIRDGTVVERELAASPSLLWAFLLPVPMYAFGEEVRLCTALWVASAWLFLGYWAARSHDPVGRGVVLAAAAATLCIGLAVVPAVLELPVAHGSEWLAAIIAFAIGWTVARAGRSA
jgi:hypothetical protein